MKDTLWLDDNSSSLIIIDQTRLPAQAVYLNLKTTDEIVDAIRRLSVRGAPAIGVAAACGVYLAAKSADAADYDIFLDAVNKSISQLSASRPTARNLFWALERMSAVLKRCTHVDEAVRALKAEAQAVIADDIAACTAIGENGLPLLCDGMRILTHCNAGRLAAARYGTALAPVYLAAERGMTLHVFADETRPLLQGARLTAYELCSAGIDCTLLCDNMAAGLMAKGIIDAVFVGGDRVAANGDTANKTGTLSLAALAKHFGIPFYVLVPFSTIDPACKTGKDITIEQREADEIISMWYSHPMAPDGVVVYNPAFDVTPSELITAIVTDRGVFSFPFSF